MRKQGFSRREFLSLAGATGGAALLAACQPVAQDTADGGMETAKSGSSQSATRLAC